MTTPKDLEMQFKRETGFNKDRYADDYYEWLEKKLIEKLDQSQQTDEFINELSDNYV